MKVKSLALSRIIGLAAIASLLSLALVFASARSASAANICVGTLSCSGPNTYPATADGLQSALLASNDVNFPGADTVYIKSGTYTATSTIQLTPNADLAIVGEGPGQTILEAGANNISNLSIFNFSLHDVTVSGLTSRSVGYGSATVLLGTNVDFDDVQIEASATSGNVYGFRASGISSISNSSFKLTGQAVTGLYSTGSVAVRNVKVASTDGESYGLKASSGGETQTIERSSFRNLRGAISTDADDIDIKDTFIQLSALYGSYGIYAQNPNDCSICAIGLNADRVTIVGTGPGGLGISTGATGADGVTESGTAVVRNSLFHLTGSSSLALGCTKSGNATSASLNTAYVAAKSSLISRTGCAGADSNQLETTSTPPTFTFPEVGDYRPLASSPVIDAGDPAEVVDPGDLDADGLDRLVDGDGSSTSEIDIGAHEFQSVQGPSSAQITATPNPANVNEVVSFSALAKEPDGGAVTYAWDFGDSANAIGASQTHTYTGPGDYTVTVVATDNEGEQSTTTTELHVASDPPTMPTDVVANKTTAYRGESITFTASGATDPDGFHYEWVFTGGGVASSAEGVGILRAATNMTNDPGPTTFSAEVRAVDIYNEKSDPVTVDVTIVNHMPTIEAIVKSKNTAYRGEDITFTMDPDDAEGDIVVGDWNFGDGQSNTGYLNSYSHVRSYSTIGVKTISLSVHDQYLAQSVPNVEDTMSTTVEILNREPVVGAVQHSGSLLVSDEQVFSVNATESEGDPLTYTWNFGDGTSAAASSANAASKTYSSPGNYTVTATVSDGQGAAVVSQKTVTVAPRKAVLKVGKPTGKFWPRNKGFALKGKRPYSFIPITSTEPVELRITMERVKGGYRKGRSCVKRKVGRKRCNLKLKGAQRIDLMDAKSNLMFGGKWAGKKLRPGSYNVILTPQDGGRAKTVRIKIIKSKR